ncbi:SAV_6107 family HEPN domain-containing protein [Actinoplanes sandaracinus]
MASTTAPGLKAASGPVHTGPASGSTHAGPPPGPDPSPVQAGAASRAEAPTVPAHMLPHRTPTQLLAIAREGLVEAARTTPDGLRYATAHLAALRAAAALLAARARPSAPGRRTRATSAWSLLVLVAPEFSDWAGYFALGASKRAAAEAGIPHVVSAREADDLLRAAEQFVAVAESALGLSYQPPLAA